MLHVTSSHDSDVEDEYRMSVPAKRLRQRRSKLRVLLLLRLAVCLCSVVGITTTVYLISSAPVTPQRATRTTVPTGSQPQPIDGAPPPRNRTVSPHTRPRTLPVSSSEQLRSVCHTYAPQLESTSWYRTFLDTDQEVIIEAPEKRANRAWTTKDYLVMPYPVCMHLSTGHMFAESADKRINKVVHRTQLVPAYLKRAHFHDIEALFTYMRNSSLTSGATVDVIPAMSVAPFGSYISTHMWHLIYDTLGPIMDAVFDAIPEFWGIPRQGVLMDEKSARWLDRGGDTPLKQRLSAAIVHGLSTFIANASSSDPATPPVAAFTDSPLVVHSTDRPPYVLGGQYPDLVSNTVCFCQSMFVPCYGIGGKPPSTLSLSTIQENTALSFGAPPYRNATQESVWDIERQRIEQYPAWARQLWPATLPAGGGAPYQPRVLFIHRARRTIANVSVYVRAMRDMGFRVEEAYLERLPTAQQYYLGRYADVVVGMHGLGIGHALWMNRYPTGCRTVIEFRLWAAKGVPVGLQDILMRRMGLYYATPEPIDVVFGRTVVNSAQARHAIKHMRDRGYQHPGWDDQEAVFSQPDVLAMIEEVKAHLLRCLPMQ